MEQFTRDLKFGLRQLLKYPVFTLVSAVALGLGIGSVTTQLSVCKAIFLSGLPFPESDRFVHLDRVNPQRDSFSGDIPIQELPVLQQEQKVFETLSGFYNGTANFTCKNNVKRYQGCFISANTFELLGVEALHGRILLPLDDEPGSPDTVLLSHKMWMNDFGGDPGVVGEKAILNGRPVTIVGVMPEGFEFPVKESLWIPLFKEQDIDGMALGDPSVTLGVFGKLRKDVSFEEAEAAMSLVARRIARDHPETHSGYSAIDVKPFKDEYMGGQTIPLSLAMLLITFLILIIACANVANLLLARSMKRQKEMAIRTAMGATRRRIISQFLTESILLASLGTVLGIFLSLANIESIKSMTVEMGAPFWMDFNFDGTVFAAVVLVTLMTGLLSGLVPAIRISKINENEILKDDTRTGSSLHMGVFSRVLVVAQISIAAVILTLVVLFVQSTRNALNLEYEYNPEETMTARIGLFEESYPGTRARANFIETLLERLRAHPEIDFAATTSRYQFLGGTGVFYDLPEAPNRDDAGRKFVRMQRISPEFFKTIQMPLHSGRHFRDADFSPGLPKVAIINRKFAEREWPNTNPVGQRFRAETAVDETPSGELPWIEVIGVVGGMQEEGLFDSEYDGAAFYIPQTTDAMPSFITILVRGNNADPASLLPVMREEVAALDRNLPLYETGTPLSINRKSMVQFEFFSSIFTSFGILATFLAAIGIYGVITFSVNQRVMEFGIRQALGATRAAIFKLVYRHAMVQLAYGFLIAILALSPLLLSQGLRDTLAIFFYGIDPDSLLPYFFSFAFVALIAVASAAPPAFRASRIHPAQALRYE